MKYGIREANEQANAAHNKYRPGPIETSIPIGTLSPMRMSLISVDLFIITVHIVAPVSAKMVVKDAKVAETTKVRLCFVTPLQALVRKVK